MYFDTAIPLVSLSGTAAGNLHGMLFSHDHIQSNVPMENRIANDANVDFPIFVSDSASSNLKYIHYYISTHYPTSYCIVKTCSPRDQAMVEQATTSCVPFDVTAQLYCCVNFISLNQHSQRCSEVLQSYVENNMALRPSGREHFIDLDELSDYVGSNCSLFDKSTNTTSTLSRSTKNSKNVASTMVSTEVRERLGY